MKSQSKPATLVRYAMIGLYMSGLCLFFAGKPWLTLWLYAGGYVVDCLVRDYPPLPAVHLSVMLYVYTSVYHQRSGALLALMLFSAGYGLVRLFLSCGSGSCSGTERMKLDWTYDLIHAVRRGAGKPRLHIK